MILRLIRITKAARQDCDRWRIGARRLFERGMVMHAAYRRTSETHRLPFGAGADAVLRPVQRVSAGTSAAARNVYGQDRRTNWPMMAVLGVVHAAMLAALVVFDGVPIMQPHTKTGSASCRERGYADGATQGGGGHLKKK